MQQTPRNARATSEESRADAIIQIEGLSKRFGPITAVHPTSFSVRRGEFFALLGPSGCGKTTLLRMLSGFYPPSSGQILIDGQDVTALPANHRPINMVFQSYAVFPHMSVGQNVAYGLKIARVPKPERARRTEEALELVRLSGMAARRPTQLSGGQQQRVALARALVMRPKVLLLDEPLSALDAKLREHMRLELVRLQKQVGITFLIVTHDQSEALSMADRVAVMNHGRLEQLADPETLYDAPASRFVADFIGRINFFPATVAQEGGRAFVLSEALGRIPAGPGAPAHAGALTVALRPEQVSVTADPPRDAPGRVVAEGEVVEQSYYGDYCNVVVALKTGTPPGADAPLITAFVINNTPEARRVQRVGQKVWCAWRESDILVINEPPE